MSLEDGMGSRKYEYVMEEAEVRECCLFLLWEFLKGQKKLWRLLLLIMAVELVLTIRFAPLTALVVGGMILIVCLNFYVSAAKALREQPSAVWIEGDRLKVQRRDYSEVPCRDMQKIRRTKRLLLIGDERLVWFVVPLRVFADGQEVERFLALLRDSQNQWQGQNQGQNRQQAEKIDSHSRNEAQEAYLNLSCEMNGARWMHLQKGAADLVNGGSLGKTPRFKGMTLWLGIATVVLVFSSWLIMGRFDLKIAVFDAALGVWAAFWLFYRNPEQKIRKQYKSPESLLPFCGLWQFSLTAEGICIRMPADRKSVYMWESLLWMLETEDAFYFFGDNKSRFFAIPKQCFTSREQVILFHRICADHGIQKIPPKKARYVPVWLMLVILVLIPLAFFGIDAAVKMSADKGGVSDYVEESPYLWF